MSVCYGCQRRTLGCHSACEEYKKECKDNEARRNWERQFRAVDSMPNTQTMYKLIYGPKKTGGRQ